MRIEDYEKWVEVIWGDTNDGPEYLQKVATGRGLDASDPAVMALLTEYERLRERFMCCVGLGEEAGEVLQPFKKHVRNPAKYPMDAERRAKIIDECGDVLFYTTKVLHFVGGSIQDALRVNVAKINGRDYDCKGNHVFVGGKCMACNEPERKRARG